ncbi:MAG: hypothetical protein R3C31_03025 [Hyphomonadaceae bacterium]
MRFIAITALLATLISTPIASAEVAAATSSNFLIQTEFHVDAAPAKVWRDLTRINHWWSAEHTYSGDASNLRLDARAGGCWCERWGHDQSVEHARVVTVMERDGVRTLRAIGGLGPLQEMGVTGVLTFTVTPHANGANVIINYRVSGDPSLNLDQVAIFVDSVLMDQMERLRRYSTSGTSD